MIQIGASAATIDSPIEHLVACHRRIEQRAEEGRCEGKSGLTGPLSAPGARAVNVGP
jgi:hypothetical protein